MRDKSVKDIIVALRYCTADDGTFCNMCPYADCGIRCSKQLLLDASDTLKYYYEKYGE